MLFSPTPFVLILVSFCLVSFFLLFVFTILGIFVRCAPSPSLLTLWKVKGDGGTQNGQHSLWGKSIEKTGGPNNGQNSLWGKNGLVQICLPWRRTWSLRDDLGQTCPTSVRTVGLPRRGSVNRGPVVTRQGRRWRGQRKSTSQRVKSLCGRIVAGKWSRGGVSMTSLRRQFQQYQFRWYRWGESCHRSLQ